MPTYEYECKKCKKRFDVFQSITAKPLKKCPDCSGKVVRLIGTGSGIIFKGSGFYATDYRSESYKQAEKKDKTSSKPDTKSSNADKSPKAEPKKTDSNKSSAA